ncbi:MAG: hypothetical protein AAFY20_09420 [Cyanobacteria bacterium J06639_14]
MARITIERFWPKDMTVNAVHEKYGRDLDLNPYTLKKALEGTLNSIQPDKLIALKKLCSAWANKSVSLDDIVLEDESDRDD